MTMADCPRCGQKVRLHARYCAGCGSPMHESTSQEKPVVRRRKNRAWMPMAAIFAAVVGMMLIYHRAGSSRSQRRFDTDLSAHPNRMPRQFRSSARERVDDDVVIESIWESVRESELSEEGSDIAAKRQFRMLREELEAAFKDSPYVRDSMPEMAEEGIGPYNEYATLRKAHPE